MSIVDSVAAFVVAQNKNRGLPGEMVPVFANALSGAVPAGDDAATGISGIAAQAAAISLGAGFNAVLLDGSHSIQASGTGQPDNYAVSVDGAGAVTLLDENTGHSQIVTGANYLVFNNGATYADGSFQSILFIESGNNAQIAEIYNAALGRQPDLAGLEYYSVRVNSGIWSTYIVASQFLASPEFQNHFAASALPADNGGANDQAFVTQLYQNVLHRTPSTSELAWYVQDIQGTLPGQTGKADRATLLIDFSISPENQKDVAGWLINPGNGVYQDTGYGVPASLPVSQVLNGVAGATINLALIDPSTIPNTKFGTFYTTVTNANPVGLTVNLNNSSFSSFSVNNITVDLSSTFYIADISTSFGDVVYGPQTGNGAIEWAEPGGIAYLYGTGNGLVGNSNIGLLAAKNTPPIPLIVYGFNSGDHFQFLDHPVGPQAPVTILPTPAPGMLYQGANYNNPSASPNFVIQIIMINVGSVADNAASSMAAAAAKVYAPQTSLGIPPNDNYADTIVFFGQGPNNDTVVYSWDNGTPNNPNHVLSATTMYAGLDLIGFAPSQITPSMFFH